MIGMLLLPHQVHVIPNVRIYVYFVLCEYGMILSSCTVLQVMQIFMPVTAQLHPKEFPGEHPNDCPRNIKKAE